MTYSRAPLFLLSYSLSCKALEVAISISSTASPRRVYAGCSRTRRTGWGCYNPRVIITSIRVWVSTVRRADGEVLIADMQGGISYVNAFLVVFGRGW
jgi:hypothetical protein